MPPFTRARTRPEVLRLAVTLLLEELDREPVEVRFGVGLPELVVSFRYRLASRS